MKEKIYHLATLLMHQNGSTTTLEVKNALYTLGIANGIKQIEVSNFMSQLIDEKSDWQRELEPTLNLYNIYSLKVNDAVVTPLVSSTTDLVQAAKDAVEADKEIKGVNDLQAVAQSNSNTLVVGKLGVHSSAFLSKLDPKVMVAYSKGKEPYLTATKDKFEARKLFKKITGEKHNEVRMITLKSFLKKQKV